MKKELSILLSSVALGVILTILFKRKRKPETPILKSDSVENFEIHLKRRREQILKQLINTEHDDTSDSLGSFYDDEDYTDEGMSFTDDTIEEVDYPSKKKNLYLYYDREIVHGDGSEQIVPEYRDGNYEGYSSYLPSPLADETYFKTEKHVNVNKLSDWNWR